MCLRHRMGRKVCWAAREASTGVYVGCVWQEYQVLLEHLHVTPTVAVLTGSGMNFMIGRVSYTMGLQGAVLRAPPRSTCMFWGPYESPRSHSLWQAAVAAMARDCIS